MRRPEITDQIKNALQGIPIDMEVRLFGSEVRGDAQAESDIDLLILVHQPQVTDQVEDTIFAPLYLIELKSGVIINLVIIAYDQWGKQPSPFYFNV